jgi:dihydroorotase
VHEPQLHKVEAVSRTLLLAEATGARVHIVHVPAPALPLIRAARERGIAVSAEAALPFVTHDLIDELEELGYDRYRSPEDALLLWQAARDGTIDVLATDHAPHALEEKRRGRLDLLASPSGYPELDTALPMLLDAVNRGVLSLERLVALMSVEPARILRLPDKGALMVGRDADLTLVDMRREGVIDSGRLYTRTRWSPFEGRRLVGWPVRTFLRGIEIARDGRLTSTPPQGRFLAGPEMSATT